MTTPHPRCIDTDVDLPAETKSSACEAPDCELPLEPGVVAPEELVYEYCNLGGLEFGVRGSCADGKLFAASLASVLGGATYYTAAGDVVGRVRYSAVIGKCECSGESWSGDVVCIDPVYEPLCGVPVIPASISLPFADGHRTAPCLCRE